MLYSTTFSPRLDKQEALEREKGSRVEKEAMPLLRGRRALFL
jgi:hypothetical protein